MASAIVSCDGSFKMTLHWKVPIFLFALIDQSWHTPALIGQYRDSQISLLVPSVS